jgi:hypothetical protein
MEKPISKIKPVEIIINEKGKLTKCTFYFFKAPLTDKLYLQCYAMVGIEVGLSELTDEERGKIVCLN